MPPQTRAQQARARRQRRRPPRRGRRPRRRPDPAALSEQPRVEAFVLAGKKLSHYVGLLITDGEIETTIEGASSLRLELREQDGELRKLIRKGVFQPAERRKARRPRKPKDPKKKGKDKDRDAPKRRGDEPAEEDLPPRLAEGTRMRAAGLDWELVGISKRGDAYTFTFEDWAVAQLRRLNEAKKVKRGKATRAEFIKSITVGELKRPKLKFICPELHDKQPIGKLGKRSEEDRDERRDRGINPNRTLYARGAKMKKSQIRMAERLLDVCDQAQAPERVMLAICMIGINETGFRNLPYSSDHLSRGVMQLITTFARSKGINNLDPEQVAKFFLYKGSASYPTGALKYARTHPSATPAEIARAVWGGMGFPVSTWTRWSREANALLAAYGGAARRKPKVRDD